MKKLTRLLIVALVAAAVTTIVVQRDRLRQIDRDEMISSMREAVESGRKTIESRLPGRDQSVEAAAADDAATVAGDG